MTNKEKKERLDKELEKSVKTSEAKVLEAKINLRNIKALPDK